jgi:hypothetical protein
MPVNAEFSWVQGATPLEVVFTDESAFYSPDTSIPSILWFFNYGVEPPSSGTVGASASHTYPAPGIYQVRLQAVAVPSGDEDIATYSVRVPVDDMSVDINDVTSTEEEIIGDVAAPAIDEEETQGEPDRNDPEVSPPENNATLEIIDDDDAADLPIDTTIQRVDCCCDCCTPVDWPMSGIYGTIRDATGNWLSLIPTWNMNGLVLWTGPKLGPWYAAPPGQCYWMMTYGEGCYTLGELGMLVCDGMGLRLLMICDPDDPTYPNSLVFHDARLRIGSVYPNPNIGVVFFTPGGVSAPTGGIPGKWTTTAFNPGTGGNATQTVKFEFTDTLGGTGDHEFYIDFTCTHVYKEWYDYMRGGGVAGIDNLVFTPYGIAGNPATIPLNGMEDCLSCMCMSNGQPCDSGRLTAVNEVVWSGGFSSFSCYPFTDIEIPLPDGTGTVIQRQHCGTNAPSAIVMRATAGGSGSFTTTIKLLAQSGYFYYAQGIGTATETVNTTGDPDLLFIDFDPVVWTTHDFMFGGRPASYPPNDVNNVCPAPCSLPTRFEVLR